jgi:hypothetical protein
MPTYVDIAIDDIPAETTFPTAEAVFTSKSNVRPLEGFRGPAAIQFSK